MEKIVSRRFAFLFALLIGCLALFLGTYLDERPGAIGISIAMMFLYGAWVYSSIKAQGNAEELADSFYYLGFMLTLVALISSIPAFSDHAKVERIVEMFGLGLCTTVLGLGGKFFFSQLTVGPLSVEDAQNALARNILDLAVQVSETTRHLKSSREEAANEVRDMTSAIAQSAVSAFEQVTSGFSASASNLLTTTTRLIEEHHAYMSQNQTALSAMLSELHREAETLKDVIKKVSTFTKKQSELLEKASLESESAMEHLRQAARSGTHFADQLISAGVPLSAFAIQCGNIAVELKNISDNLHSQKENADALASHVREDLATVEAYKKSIQERVNEAQKLTAQVHLSLVDASQFIITKLSPNS